MPKITSMWEKLKHEERTRHPEEPEEIHIKNTTSKPENFGINKRWGGGGQVRAHGGFHNLILFEEHTHE